MFYFGLHDDISGVVNDNLTSSAGAERSDGPHKGGARRTGPNDFMFVYNLMQRDLSISIFFVLLVMFSFFCNLSTIHNLATYAY